MIIPDDKLKARMEAAVQDAAQERYQNYLDESHGHLAFIEGVCQSPIELLLAAYICGMSDGYQYVEFTAKYEQRDKPKFGTLWSTQTSIGKYVADFSFWCFGNQKSRGLIVECDGHEFHEKTKEQASRDKRRDRYFVSNGLSVLHFTGSEIYRDPENCIDEISATLTDILEDLMGWKRGRKGSGT